jgi:hypothetical protein
MNVKLHFSFMTIITFLFVSSRNHKDSFLIALFLPQFPRSGFMTNSWEHMPIEKHEIQTNVQYQIVSMQREHKQNKEQIHHKESMLKQDRRTPLPS